MTYKPKTLPVLDGGTGVTTSTGTGSVVLSNAPSITNVVVSGIDLDMAIFADQKAQNTVSGTFTSGAWQTRDLNTISYEKDTDSWFSLASDQFTLTAGKYLVEASAPAFNVSRHKARIQNITDTSTEILGQSQYSAGNAVQSNSDCFGVIDISATKTFELQHRCETTHSTDGFGVAGNIAAEIYSQVKIVRLGV